MVRHALAAVAFGALGCGGIAVADASGAAGTGSAGVDGGATSSDVRATVAVRDAAGRSISDADVLVSAADGSVASTARTGADGRVGVAVPIGGSVSLLVKASSGPSGVPTVTHTISSAYGIADGQTILFLLSALAGSTSDATMTLDLHATGPASAVSFYFSVPCWSARAQTQTTLEITGFSGCSGKKTFDAYVFALDAAGTVLAYGSVLDRPFVAGGRAELAIDVRSTAIARQAVRVTPTDPTAALTVFMLGYRDGDFDRGATTGLRFQTSIDPSGAMQLVDLPWPAGRFSDFKFGARLESERNGLRRVTSFDRFQRSLPAASSFDQGALAGIETLDLDGSVVDRPVVRWTLSDAGALGDAVKISTDWSGAEYSTGWSIAAPPSRVGSARLPVLPAAWRDFAPSSAVTYGVLSARHFDDMAYAGYGDYLATRILDDASNVDSSSVSR